MLSEAGWVQHWLEMRNEAYWGIVLNGECDLIVDCDDYCGGEVMLIDRIVVTRSTEILSRIVKLFVELNVDDFGRVVEEGVEVGAWKGCRICTRCFAPL